MQQVVSRWHRLICSLPKELWSPAAVEPFWGLPFKVTVTGDTQTRNAESWETI